MKRNWKVYVAAGAAMIVVITVLVGVFGQPVLAQIRAALVRDVDTPALAPFSARVTYSLCCLNDQRLLTTVPAGKRLVIEYLSYASAGAIGDQAVWGALRNGQFGPMVVFLEIHPLHPSADAGYTFQDGSQPVKAYFEAGEQVWVSFSHNTSSYRDLDIRVAGYYITP